MAKIESDAGGAWDDPSAGSGGGGGSNTWLKLKKRHEPYRVRLASSPEIFRQHYAAFKILNLKRQPISPSLKDDGSLSKDDDIAWNEGGWVPGKRFASLVIDRECGQIRILESGAQVFNAFGNYSKMMGSNPAGENGPDWLISVGTDANGKNEYTAIPDIKKGATPFTPEEKAMIENCKIDLKKLYKRSTPEEISALWHKLPDDKKYNPDRKTGQWKDKDQGQHSHSQSNNQSQQGASSYPTDADDGSDDVSDDSFLNKKAQENIQKTTPPVANTAAATAPVAKPVNTEKKAASLF